MKNNHDVGKTIKLGHTQWAGETPFSAFIFSEKKKETYLGCVLLFICRSPIRSIIIFSGKSFSSSSPVQCK